MKNKKVVLKFIIVFFSLFSVLSLSKLGSENNFYQNSEYSVKNFEGVNPYASNLIEPSSLNIEDVSSDYVVFDLLFNNDTNLSVLDQIKFVDQYGNEYYLYNDGLDIIENPGDSGPGGIYALNGLCKLRINGLDYNRDYSIEKMEYYTGPIGEGGSISNTWEFSGNFTFKTEDKYVWALYFDIFVFILFLAFLIASFVLTGKSKKINSSL